MNFVDGDEPPMLLLQGGGDRTVAPRNASSLAARMRARSEPVELEFYPGIGHIGLLLALSPPGRAHSPALADTLAFIKAHAARPNSNGS